jgi:hypothetical protein
MAGAHFGWEMNSAGTSGAGAGGAGIESNDGRCIDRAKKFGTTKMLFSSPAFFVFFVCYFALHVVVPRSYRNYLIIAASTVFYAWWKVEYV